MSYYCATILLLHKIKYMSIGFLPWLTFLNSSSSMYLWWHSSGHFPSSDYQLFFTQFQSQPAGKRHQSGRAYFYTQQHTRFPFPGAPPSTSNPFGKLPGRVQHVLLDTLWAKPEIRGLHILRASSGCLGKWRMPSSGFGSKKKIFE